MGTANEKSSLERTMKGLELWGVGGYILPPKSIHLIKKKIEDRHGDAEP